MCIRDRVKPAAALLALAGMLPPERAGEILRLDGPRGLSTFMSYYILRGAAAGGHMTQALDMMRAYYGAMLDLGATTFWEEFDLDWACKASPIDRLPHPGESDVHGDNGAHCYSEMCRRDSGWSGLGTPIPKCGPSAPCSGGSRCWSKAWTPPAGKRRCPAG